MLVLSKGPRAYLPHLEAVVAARRWADGWRGGLLGTCDFDLGFDAASARRAFGLPHGVPGMAGACGGSRDREGAESSGAPTSAAPSRSRLAANGSERAILLSGGAVLLVDPAAGLVDPALLDEVIEHAEAHPNAELCFAPAAPGLAGTLIRLPLLDRLAAAGTHPGRLLHYHPDVLSREPLAEEMCVRVPTPVARSTRRFALSSDRQIARLTAATEGMNGEDFTSSAEQLVRRVQSRDAADPLRAKSCWN